MLRARTSSTLNVSAAGLVSAVEATVREHGIPQLGVVVVGKEGVRYSRVFAGPNGEPSINENHLFHLASVSKTFVALGIIRMAEQGRIKLGDPVQKYVPELAGRDERLSRITIEQLLTHTSGLPDTNDYEWEKPQFDNRALGRWISTFMRDRELQTDPGLKWAYSNYGYEVLGLLLENVSGKPFEEFMTTDVLAPLGMRSSTFATPAIPTTLRVTGHLGPTVTQASPVYPYNRRHAPSSTLHSSLPDLASALQLFVSDGPVGPISRASFQQMAVSRAKAFDDVQMGLGWFLGEKLGRRAIFHDGNDRGFRSAMVVLPDDHIGIAVNSNYQAAPVEKIADLVASWATGGPLLSPTPAPLPRRMEQTRLATGIDAALAKYDAEVRADKDAPYGVYQLGISLIEREKWADAIAVQHYLIKLNPEDGYAYRDLGRALIGSGDPGGAIPPLEQAVRMLPTNQPAKDLLSQARELAGLAN